MKTLLAVIALLCAMYAPPVVACSCVGSKETDRSAREYVRRLFTLENVILVRATDVTRVTEDREIARLVVVKSWKGRYLRGDSLTSDTSGIGGGMCDAPIRVGQEILVAFNTEPVRINGCPSDFELTPLELEYLRKLAPWKRKTRVNSMSTNPG
jgi:hypothetical protein